MSLTSRAAAGSLGVQEFLQPRRALLVEIYKNAEARKRADGQEKRRMGNLMLRLGLLTRQPRTYRKQPETAKEIQPAAGASRAAAVVRLPPRESQ